MIDDILIIGSGLTGLLAARELSSAGASVTVLERGALSRESSWAGGGILSPIYPWRYPEPVNVLAKWSQDHFEQLASELHAGTGVDPEFIRSGMLMLDRDEQDRALCWARDYGAELEVVDAERSRAIEPGLGDVDTALWMPQVGQVRNPRLLQALQRDLSGRGVCFRQATEARALQIESGRVTGVDTAEGLIPAGKVVVAGGAWTRQFLGDDLGATLEVVPVRGQMVLFKTPPGLIRPIVMKEGRYVIPRRDGHVLVGSTLEYEGFDKVTTDEAGVSLRQAALALVPALADYPIVNHWAGLRPGSPDGVPYIGEHPGVTGLYVSTGHFRNGVVMGPASARLLADLILKRRPCLNPEPYAIK